MTKNRTLALLAIPVAALALSACSPGSSEPQWHSAVAASIQTGIETDPTVCDAVTLFGLDTAESFATFVEDIAGMDPDATFVVEDYNTGGADDIPADALGDATPTNHEVLLVAGDALVTACTA